MHWRGVLFGITIAAVMMSQAVAARRVALVIGNANYVSQSPLNNPINDARNIGGRLRQLGFDLIGGAPLYNLKRAQLSAVLNSLLREGRGADAVVFYYSGHGSEINGINYLITSDDGQVSADVVLAQFDATNARIKMMLLDACRSNPFEPTRQAGFAPMNAPATGLGLLIGYATQPRTNASDGPSGQNSPYAAALLEAMQSKGLDIWPFFQQVAFGTMRRTGNAQRPWITASPIGSSFYFNPTDVVVQAPPPSPNTPAAQEPSPAAAYASAAYASAGGALQHIEQAYAYLGQENYRGALQVLNKARSVDPNSAIAESYTGFTYYRWALAQRSHADRLDAYKTGFPHLDRAMRLDPVYAYVRRHHGNMIVATYISLKESGRPVNDIMSNALRSLGDSARLDPTSIRSPAAIGMAHLVAKNYEESLRWFGKALELNSRYAVAYSGRCMAYRLLGRDPLAQANAAAAADRDSDLRNRPCLAEDVYRFWERSSAEF